MNNGRTRRKYSQLSHRILLQYTFSILGLIVGTLAAYFLAWYVCMQFVWLENSWLYRIFKLLQRLSPVIIVLIILVGAFLLTRRFLTKPLEYLDAVVDAAKSLSQPSDEPIKLPEEIRDVENELNLAREQTLRSTAAAKEAEQRKNDLVVYLAHDLKTPLTSVIGYLTLLRDEPQISPELRAKYTGIALDKAERLEELINEFFDITRFNLTHLELERESVDLTRMLEQITFEFNPVLAEKDLSWDLHLAPKVQIICDPDKLERVFDNLFRNAVNYSYAQTQISVSLTQNDGSALVRISNRGKTIPPEKLSRIFEQFFRLDSSRATATGGAGLGLAIAKEIVELHGGRIAAESAEERITFTVTLPRQ